MKKTISLLLFAFAVLQISSSQEFNNKSLTGSWMGKLEVSAIQLRIVFNLSTIEKDSLVATMDSPDQGAKGIKLGLAKFDGKNLKIAAPAILGEYNGIIVNDTLINGTWKQAGRELPLNLTKLKAVFALNRPQEPKPPFPYRIEEVTFTNRKENFTLAGTLTVPDGGGPFPAVILITGSGAQNRDEELLGHKPFLIIADYLTRNGIAVLRYDDRGVGKSKGSLTGVTSADFAVDAASAVEFLKTQPAINHNLIGLAGHSEGGLIAPMVAAGSNDIAFIISLAGPGVTGEEILYRQSYDITVASGVEIKEAEKGVAINKKLYGVLKNEKDNVKAQEKMTKIYKESLEQDNTPPEKALDAMKQFQASITGITDPWFRYFLTTDPSDWWKKVKCPVLALNGQKDLQVSYQLNLPSIEKAIKSGGNKAVTTIAMPDLNHLFQHCKTGLPAEYGEIEETFSPEALKIMSDWILSLKASQPAF